MDDMYKRLMNEIEVNEIAEENLTKAIAETRIELRKKGVSDELTKETLDILDNSREMLRTLLRTKIKIVNEIADIGVKEALKGE